MASLSDPVYDGERGASAVEYSLIVVAIAAILVLVVFAVGEITNGAFDTTCQSLESGEFSGGHTC